MADWTGEPAYKQLAAKLRERITRGALPPGTQLPRTSELMAEHDVSITVVRMAFDELRTEGLVSTHQGKGAFVLDPAKRERSGVVNPDFEAVMRRLDELQERIGQMDDRLTRFERRDQAEPPSTPTAPRDRQAGPR